jgi:hypothetical protein
MSYGKFATDASHKSVSISKDVGKLDSSLTSLLSRMSSGDMCGSTMPITSAGRQLKQGYK